MTNIAHKIIKKLGGVDVVARMTGVDVSRVYRWTYEKQRGGTGGRVPYKHVGTLIARATELGIDLTPNDFFDLPPEGNG